MADNFGDYEDRETENDIIRRNPPAAVGDPAGTSIIDTLESLFEERDNDHFTEFEAVAPNGSVLLLQFDTNLTAEEYERFNKVAESGNRAARRSGRTESKPWLSAAAMISEKSTRIKNKATGKVYKDAQGDQLTLVADEWLSLAGCPGDPITATLKFFGFPQVVALGNGYVQDTGLDTEAQRVDPTRG